MKNLYTIPFAYSVPSSWAGVLAGSAVGCSIPLFWVPEFLPAPEMLSVMEILAPDGRLTVLSAFLEPPEIKLTIVAMQRAAATIVKQRRLFSAVSGLIQRSAVNPAASAINRIFRGSALCAEPITGTATTKRISRIAPIRSSIGSESSNGRRRTGTCGGTYPPPFSGIWRTNCSACVVFCGSRPICPYALYPVW